MFVYMSVCVSPTLCVSVYVQVTLVALVCVMILIDLIELVILSLPIGPSHEL